MPIEEGHAQELRVDTKGVKLSVHATDYRKKSRATFSHETAAGVPASPLPLELRPAGSALAYTGGRVTDAALKVWVRLP